MTKHHRHTPIDEEVVELPNDPVRLVSMLRDAESLFARASTEYRRRSGERRVIIEKLRALRNTGEMQVSDHAVLRYLQRVEGIDIDLMRNVIAEAAAGLPDGLHPFPGTELRLVVVDGLVITLRPTEPKEAV